MTEQGFIRDQKISLHQGPSGHYTIVVDHGFTPSGSHVSQALSGEYAPLTPEDATKALVQALVQNARFTLDGSSPTASTGFRITAGDPPMAIPVTGSIKFIQELAGAVLELQWGY
jgi:hypothetical protein